MQINVGSLDRIVRIVVGLVLLSLPLWLDSSWRWLGLIGIMPLITGLALSGLPSAWPEHLPDTKEKTGVSIP